MGSTKEIQVSGTFDAKSGFDLSKKFTIVIEKEKAIVTFPAPEILSVESRGDIQFRDENGIWNWVSEEDRSRAVNAFVSDARRYAHESHFASDSSVRMQARLLEILKSHVSEVELRVGDQRFDIELEK
jgi:hypothetical protein